MLRANWTGMAGSGSIYDILAEVSELERGMQGVRLRAAAP